MISPIRGLGLLALALLLSGCARNVCPTGPHVDAVAVPPLVIPEGLDAPDRRLALRVPGPGVAPGRPPSGPCVSDPPRFFAESGEPNPENLPIRPGSLYEAGVIARTAPPSVTEDVTAFVEQWAESWGRRDFDAWVRLYHPRFTPEGYESNAAWRAEQQRLFEVPATTSIEPDSVTVSMRADGTTRARFVQQFGLGDNVRAVVKELTLAPHPSGTGWLITDDRIVEML